MYPFAEYCLLLQFMTAIVNSMDVQAVTQDTIPAARKQMTWVVQEYLIEQHLQKQVCALLVLFAAPYCVLILSCVLAGRQLNHIGHQGGCLCVLLLMYNRICQPMHRSPLCGQTIVF